MKVILVVLLVSCVAGAHPGEAPQNMDFPDTRLDTADAKLLDVRPIAKLEPAPGNGLWMDEVAAVEQARRIKACETERAELRKTEDKGAPWWLVGLGVVVGAGLGAMVAGMTLRK